MRDLKDLLEPLGDRPMPDRWESIQHRPIGPMPEEPHRSRLGAGIAAAAIAILAVAVIAWLSPLGGTGTEPESSTSPQPSQYVSPQGWTVTVPPGWTTTEVSVGRPGGAMQGTVISSQPVGSPVLNEFAIPIIPSGDFPSNAVALTIGDLPDANGGTQPARPPLAYSDFKGAGSTGNATVRALSFEGPRQLFFATTQVGTDASATDAEALRATIASLAFGDEAGVLPSPSGAPGLPTQNAVVDDRFVSDVVLDDGAFSVEPAPIGTVPVITKADAEQLLYASPLLQGKSNGVLGFGLVTSRVSQYGVPTYRSDPAWIAFGWGGATNCPNETVPSSPADLPSGGYVAVALVEGAGGGDLSYEARSDTCGTLTGPTVRPATHVESVPWTSNGQVTGGDLQITYTPPACAGSATYSAAGSGDTVTLSVEVDVPDTPGSCANPAPITDVVPLNDGTQTVASVKHAPTGIVRQAGF